MLDIRLRPSAGSWSSISNGPYQVAQLIEDQRINAVLKLSGAHEIRPGWPRNSGAFRWIAASEGPALA